MNRADTSVTSLDADRTVLVPRPGGRPQPVLGKKAAIAAHSAHPTDPGAEAELGAGASASASASAGGSQKRTSGAPSQPAAGDMPTMGGQLHSKLLMRHGLGLNPLIRAANPLLDLVVPLRFLSAGVQVDALRSNLVRGIKNFESEAKNLGVDPQAIAVARYALCTLLDETVASTPIGVGGAWASKSLLVAFHNEAWGGEKFFLILRRLAQEPERHLHLLELQYLCLALGLEGRYRVMEGGRAQVEELRERLLGVIQTQRGAVAATLSLHWKPVPVKAPLLLDGLPVWRMATAAGIVILAMRMAMLFTLELGSEPLVQRLAQIHMNAPAPNPALGPASADGVLPIARPASVPDFPQFLAPEIAYGMVVVQAFEGGWRITLRGEGVFASGSAEVLTSFKPILDRIAEALATLDGPVTVVGHTDDLPSVTAQFPSNEALSLARAQSVVTQLVARTANPTRYVSKGMGATQPLVANDSPANRARNRRVDIVIALAAPAK